jgi:hypothetical protein
MQPLVGELARVDDAIRVAGRTHEMLLPLTSLFSFEKENLEGDDPKLLAQDTLRLYTDMLNRCQLIQRKIRTLSGILRE